ncbi:MAG: penicillin-binding protein 2 [Proteobacteria bacterium]|nr:penicillin-binding protein 2 [Pseudomonadota bacterium]
MSFLRHFWKDQRRRGDREAGPVFQPRRSPVQQRRIKVNPSRGLVDSSEAVVGEHFRVVVTMFALTLCFAIVGGKLAFVALMPPVEPQPSIREMPKEALRRGNIYDRNGVLLAATLKVYSLYADPKRVLDAAEAANKIPAVLPGVSPVHLLAQLTDPTRRFIWVKRRMTPDEAAKVHALGLPGFEFRDEFVRIYPHRGMAGNLLGGVDVDNNGLAGVERAFDSTLKAGEDVHLALDVRLQELFRKRVEDAVEKSGAKAGMGLVMYAPTREIVAMVSLPDFDPNHFGKATPDERFNRVTLGSYEMGSTFKLFTLAQALDEGKVTPNTLIDCRVPIQIGKYTIKDYHAKKSILTAQEVLRYSSNIGAAHIADMSGPEAQKEFLAKLGMLAPLPVGVAEVGNVRYPDNWGRIQSFTIAFGHGIAVTPVHLVAAVAALADGYFGTPSVLKGGVLDKIKPVRVVAASTLAQIHDLMRDVVVNGSGRQAEVLGFDVGGKTGTAEKIGARGYDHSKNMVSFVGLLPVKNPKYVTLVMLDEPKKGFETGGKSAAPAVGLFYKDLVQLEGLAPDMEEVAAFKKMLERNHLREDNPWSIYMLSQMRIQRGEAGGVPLSASPASTEGFND